MQNLSTNGTAFTQTAFDTNEDGEIGSADLLSFLIAYGATLDQLGGNSAIWQDPEYIYSPQMQD